MSSFNEIAYHWCNKGWRRCATNLRIGPTRTHLFPPGQVQRAVGGVAASNQSSDTWGIGQRRPQAREFTEPNEPWMLQFLGPKPFEPIGRCYLPWEQVRLEWTSFHSIACQLLIVVFCVPVCCTVAFKEWNVL